MMSSVKSPVSEPKKFRAAAASSPISSGTPRVLRQPWAASCTLVVRPARIGVDVGQQDHGLGPQRLDARAVAEALLDAVQDDGPGAAPRHRHGLLPALQRHAAFDLGAGGVAECGRRELSEAAEEVLDVLGSHQEVLQLQGGFVPGVVGHA